MSLEVLFCHGCNEKFAVSENSRKCPQCGLTLDGLANAPTLAYEDLAARGTYLADAGELNEADAVLVGRQFGIYDVLDFLGKGGMARVYRARHLMLERLCAIKVLNPQLVERNPEYVDMFLSEARAAASLVHPHVVTIHTIGHDAGWHYIEMEYVHGQSLSRHVEAAGKLDPTQATNFMVQIASALSEAHRMDMVHRDIKPANVLVTARGDAKLADFGLAKPVLSLRNASGPRSGAAGTPHYMAPELFQGHPADKRSDVYAMGVTYFCLLTGRLPFAGKSISEMAQLHSTQAVPDLCEYCPTVPHDAVRVVLRCLAKDPTQRYGDASELYDDLKAVYGGLRSLGSLVTEAVEGLDVEMEGAGEQYNVRVALAAGRSQRVYIECTAAECISERVVKIYSVCGPASESYFRRALELNAIIPHGSIAIENIAGQPHFVMGNTYPRATCDPREIRHSLLTIARHADEVERILTSRDVH